MLPHCLKNPEINVPLHRRTPSARRYIRLIPILVLLAGTLLPASQAPPTPHRKKLSAQELLRTANALFERGDYAHAQMYYLEALPSYPRSFQVLRKLGYCYYRSGASGTARAAHFFALAHEVNPTSRDVALSLARCYMALQRYDEATALLRELTAAPAAPLETWKMLAESYDAARHPADAEAAYETYLQRNPADGAARSDLGRLYGADKRYAKALEQFQLALSAQPDFSPALVGKARVFAWQGHYEESLKLYQHVLSKDSRNAEALTGEAFVLLWTGNAEEARKLFSELRQSYPQDGDISRGLEEAQAAIEDTQLAAARGEGDTAQLEAPYRRRLAENSNDVDALRALATLTTNPQRCTESIQYAGRALELSPRAPALKRIMARSLSTCRRYGEAIAHYRQVLEWEPRNEAAMAELGDLLLRAGKFEDSRGVFQNLRQVNPANPRGTLGLAQALARIGEHQEALTQYEEVLKTSPENYDALQGKAFVLFWTHQYDEARTLFKRLAARVPSDPQNAEALRGIANAEEEARWNALRPPRNAPPRDFADYFQKRLTSHPKDEEALKGLANAQVGLKNLEAARQAYQRALQLNPNDRDAKVGLAQVLSFTGHYDDAIRLYREIRAKTPNDIEMLEGLGRTLYWSGFLSEARDIFQRLATEHPSQLGYRIELARVAMRLEDYPAAREALNAVLSADPRNREARLQLASVDVYQGHFQSALRQFNRLLEANPTDFEALLGNARIAYFQGNLKYARELVTKLVDERPDDFDAVLLLANIEHALHDRQKTRKLLARAAQLAPHNAEVQELDVHVREASRVTLHTSASWAREIGSGMVIADQPALGSEDLRTFAYEATLGFSALPRSDSSLSLYYLPSNSPSGGIQGAVGPSQFLYRQNTYLFPNLTLRGGVGMARFGPGGLENLPGQVQPIATGTVSPIGFGNLTYRLRKSVSLDLTAARSAITYTPAAVRLGVIENRFTGGLNFLLSPHTELHLEYFYARASSVPYDHVGFIDRTTQVVENKADHDRGHGGALLFNRSLLRSKSLSFDVGYSGLAYGYAGRREHIFMGFFNPSFYQRHYLTTRLAGTLREPFGYDFSGGLGIQQVEQGAALTRALVLSPAITLKASSRLTLTLGYIHYNSAQSLGALRGNAVRLSTDWKF